jgi:hypothetical protein
MVNQSDSSLNGLNVMDIGIGDARSAKAITENVNKVEGGLRYFYKQQRSI